MPTPISSQDQHNTDTAARMAALMLGRLQGDETPAAAAELDAWLEAQPAASRAFYGQIVDTGALETALDRLYRIDETAALLDVRERLQPSAVTKPAVVRSLRRHQVAAAVAALLLLGAGLYYFLFSRNHNTSLPLMADRYQSDAAPGGNKATLQLADGRVITLDSVANGQLAREQHTLITKDSTGRISYAPGASADDAPLAYNTIRVPRGGQYQVILPDGSHVWLNAASTLRYPTAFRGGVREVELTGEAYFDIAPDARHYFQVQVQGAHPATVQVLGTGFNVNAYDDESANVTTLVTGKVKVLQQSQEALLIPGQAAYAFGAGQAMRVQAANMDATLAWKEGLFSLENADITDIMRQLSRWYDVDVVYNGTVKQHFVGRIPRDMQLSSVLKVLESTGWVHFSVSGKTVTVMP